jgi:2-dehydropantoate 2-reductase
MKVCIIGAGAMGSLLGFYLCAQAEVWLLTGWQAQIDAIKAAGLRCERDGIAETRHPHATADPGAIGPCDVVLVLVKAHQTARAAEQARSLLTTDHRRPTTGAIDQRPEARDQRQKTGKLKTQNSKLKTQHTLVVTLQNGVGNREALAAALGAEHVGQGVTSLGATLLGPGHVRHAGMGPTIFGTEPNRIGMAALAELFSASGLPAQLSDNLDALVWGKLVVNAGINALTALLRISNGALAEIAEVRDIVARAVAEAAAVAAARGVRLPYDDPLEHVLSVARATGANRSSMLQDVLRGSPTEIAVINGAVLREGQRLGIAAPVNQLLAELVAALDATAQARVHDV